jgi:RNA polymerase sigma factor (sigma-70 family)
MAPPSSAGGYLRILNLDLPRASDCGVASDGCRFLTMENALMYPESLVPTVVGDEPLENFLPSRNRALRRILLRRFQALRPDEIDDVLMIALARLWANRKHYDRTKGSVATWYHRIAVNVAANLSQMAWIRARKLEITGHEFDQIAPPDRRAIEPDEEYPAGPAASINTQLRQRLREALADLSEGERRTVLADAEAPTGHVSSSALADELNVTTATIRSYRWRGMKKLRNSMARWKTTSAHSDKAE